MNEQIRGTVSRLWLRAGLLMVGAALAVFTWLAVAQSDENLQAHEEDQRFSQLTDEVTNRVTQVGGTVRALQGLFRASDDVTRREFHEYTSAMGLGNGEIGVQAAQYAPWVAHAQRAGFEARVRRDSSLEPAGYPDFAIKPAGERPFYAPTEYNEPMSGNESAFGFDSAFGPVRATALETARDTGQPIASAPFRLVQAPGVGVAIRGPIYRKGPTPGDVQERRAAYEGQVSVVFLVDTLMGGALGSHLGANNEITLRDLGPTSSRPSAQDELPLGRYGLLPQQSWRHVDHVQSQVRVVFGRFWEVSMYSRLLNPYLDAKSLLAGGLVLSLTLLVAAVMNRTVAQRDLAQARASTVLEATLTPIITADASGIIQSANRAATSLFGYSESQLQGQPFATLMPEAAAALTGVARTTGGVAALLGATHNIQGMTRDGSRLPLAMSLSDVGTGPRRHFLASFHDMSAQHRIDEQRRAFAGQLEATVQSRTAELTRVNDELESFAYSVAHDLRAPVRHVHGFARLLQTRHDTSMDAKARDYVGRIVRAAGEMGRLIDDLLAFSQLGHRELSSELIDMNDLAAQCRTSVSGTLGGPDIDWRIDPLPAVHGDAALMRLALSNLLSNAVKYSAARHPPVIEIFADESAPGETRFCVRDNGVGFDMQYAHQLFKVFSRLHHADEFEGTGVGLANVRRIIERHGGRIWAQAEPGVGAQFWFALPKEAA